MDIAWFKDLKKEDVAIAGGKGANLGEVTNAKLQVPPGFVITTDAFNKFLGGNGLNGKIGEILGTLNFDNSWELEKASRRIQELINYAQMPSDVAREITDNYYELVNLKGEKDRLVAVRSSANTNDLSGGSFADQQDTYLNVDAENIINSVINCWSSLFAPRAIFFREKRGKGHTSASMAVIIQKMVNGEKSGVMFSVHPATGEKDKVVIEAGWGLGEGVVSGVVTPDHYVISKHSLVPEVKEISKKNLMFISDHQTGKTVTIKPPEEKIKSQVLTDFEINLLKELAVKVENHYGKPQDIEWAFEGGELFLLQARPINVLLDDESEMEEEREEREVLVRGLGSSPGVGSGRVSCISGNGDMEKMVDGNIMVTTMTYPHMIPAMKKARGIVVQEGGRTCHASIISRELGIPCVVGAANATGLLKDGMEITVDGKRGLVYPGVATMEGEKGGKRELIVPSMDFTATGIKANISIPDIAYRVAPIADGVGLLRVEHLILATGRHPGKFIRDGKEKELIDRIAEGVKEVARAFYPKPVWYRTLDAPTAEFRSLEGGDQEPIENNPMLGWRGIRRGLQQRELLLAEFKVIKKLMREGLNNIGVMIPLVQHPDELREAKKIALELGIRPGKDFKFGIMVETPAAALSIEDFIAEGLDFVSLGTNDLTQFTLAVDRNNEKIAHLYKENHPAVMRLIEMTIKACRKAGVETSICGQAASGPLFAKKLVEWGISSISTSPESVLALREIVARTERNLLLEKARK